MLINLILIGIADSGTIVLNYFVWLVGVLCGLKEKENWVKNANPDANILEKKCIIKVPKLVQIYHDLDY